MSYVCMYLSHSPVEPFPLRCEDVFGGDPFILLETGGLDGEEGRNRVDFGGIAPLHSRVPRYLTALLRLTQ